MRAPIACRKDFINQQAALQTIGQLYFIHAPFLFLGMYGIVRFFRKRTKELLLLLAWFLIVPLPAGLAKETPHALRLVSILPLPHILIAAGLLLAYDGFVPKIKKLFIVAYAAAVVVSMAVFLHDYTTHYPVTWSGEWQYGYKQVVEKVSKIQKNYDHIVVTNTFGRPYIYFLFYQQIDPLYFNQQVDRDRDWAGLRNVYGFDKFRFNLSDAEHMDGKVLLVGKPGEIPDSAKIRDTVLQPNGEVVFVIAEK